MQTTLAQTPATDARHHAAPAGTQAERALAMLRLALQSVLGGAKVAEVIQLSRRGGLALVEDGAERKVFKLINCQADWKKRWARRVGWNPARSAQRMSRALGAAGVRVCEVERHGGVNLAQAPRAVWTLSQYVPQARTLRQLKLELQPGRMAPAHALIARLYEDALRLLRKIHDAGFEHRDYHAGNLLVAPAGEGDLHSGAAQIGLVDLETVVARRATHARRARDLRRFIENFIEPAGWRAQIDHALAVYADGDTALAGRILATRRMAGLVRLRGVTRAGA